MPKPPEAVPRRPSAVPQAEDNLREIGDALPDAIHTCVLAAGNGCISLYTL